MFAFHQFHTTKNLHIKVCIMHLDVSYGKSTKLIALLRIYRHLSCQHGCNDGHRGPPADFLRHTGQALLARLHRHDQSAFRRFLRTYVKVRPIPEILEFFHAFLGFCVDPGSLLSPMSKLYNQDDIYRLFAYFVSVLYMKCKFSRNDSKVIRI